MYRKLDTNYALVGMVRYLLCDGSLLLSCSAVVHGAVVQGGGIGPGPRRIWAHWAQVPAHWAHVIYSNCALIRARLNLYSKFSRECGPDSIYIPDSVLNSGPTQLVHRVFCINSGLIPFQFALIWAWPSVLFYPRRILPPPPQSTCILNRRHVLLIGCQRDILLALCFYISEPSIWM